MNILAIKLSLDLIVFVCFVMVTSTVYSINMVLDKSVGQRWGLWKSCLKKDSNRYLCSPIGKNGNLLKQARGYAVTSLLCIFIAAILAIFTMRYSYKPLLIVLTVLLVVFFGMAVVTTVLVIMFASKQLKSTPNDQMNMGPAWWVYLSATVLAIPAIVLSGLVARYSGISTSAS